MHAAARRFLSSFRTKILALSAAALIVSCLGISDVSAQAAPFGGLGPKSEEPLQMVIDYGVGQPKHHESHHGVIEPVALPANQQVAITLQFLRKRAGSAVRIGRLDGGEIDLQGPVTIPLDGSVLFHFHAGGVPGLYRLLVDGPERYEISLYAIDPNRAPRFPKPAGH